MTQAQALVVRKYLVDNFKLDESRVKTKGFGEQTSNQKNEQQSRVEILVYNSSTTKSQRSTKISRERFYIFSINKLFLIFGAFVIEL